MYSSYQCSILLAWLRVPPFVTLIIGMIGLKDEWFNGYLIKMSAWKSVAIFSAVTVFLMLIITIIFHFSQKKNKQISLIK